MLYFKVVHNKDGILTSATTQNNYAIIYKLNKWTKPNNPQSKLFIFDSQENTKTYFEQYLFSQNYQIYKCEAKKVEPAPPAIPGQYHQFDDFWKNQQMTWTCIPPEGTLMAQMVRLIELVK
jgi:hypothetical protein